MPSNDVLALTGTEQLARWNVAAPLGTSVVVTYSFGSSQASYDGTARPGYTGFTETQKVYARQALETWAAVSGIAFVEVPEAAGGQIRIGHFDMSGYLNSTGQQASGFAYFPWYSWTNVNGAPVYQPAFNNIGGDIFMNANFYAGNDAAMEPGQRGYSIFLHEMGHALGFKHPFEGSPTIDPAHDSGAYSVLSYNRPNSTTQLGSVDIEASQYYYGATDLAMSFDAATLTLTRTGTGAGEWVLGTELKDVLLGGAGNDQVRGELGNDTLIGGTGSDTITGGSGGDTFRFAFADLEGGLADRIQDYVSGSDAIRILSNVAGNTVTTFVADAFVNFGNGYQIFLIGKAGSVIRLDFDNRWEYWDTGANAAWSRYTDYLNSSGQVSDQEIVNDNGTLTQRHVDLSPGGTLHAWIEYTDYFNVGALLTDQEIRYDNGSIGQRHIAQAGTLEYTDYVTPGGVLLDQEVINLNGTREQRHFDPSNSRSTEWASYIDYFNAGNPAQITAKSMVYDAGAFTHGTFGVVHQTQWEYAVAGDTSHGVARYYNAANALLGQELF